jgi:hypothetical protein
MAPVGAPVRVTWAWAPVAQAAIRAAAMMVFLIMVVSLLLGVTTELRGGSETKQGPEA